MNMKIDKSLGDFYIKSLTDGPKFRRDPKRMIMKHRDGVKMSCVAKCVPSCKFSWFKDDGVGIYENITTTNDESQLKVL